jgi:hypothetical protein
MLDYMPPELQASITVAASRRRNLLAMITIVRRVVVLGLITTLMLGDIHARRASKPMITIVV